MITTTFPCLMRFARRSDVIFLTFPKFELPHIAICRPVSTGRKTKYIESHYDEKERNTILEFINTSAEEDLIRFSLGKVKSRILCKLREQLGNFENLEVVADKLSVKENIFKKFCETVLLKESIGFASKHRLSSVLTPNCIQETLLALPSVVGLQIGANASLAWAEVTNSYELINWNHVNQPDTANKKLTPCTLFSTVQRLCDQLPDADAFVLEAPPTMLPHQAYVQMYIQRREVQATLLALLNSRTPQKDRVYFLKSRFASRLYGIQIGSERVSSQPVVEKLLQGEGVGPNESSRLTLKHAELQAAYRAQVGPDKEARANSLLLCMAFLKLAVHEDQACLRALHI